MDDTMKKGPSHTVEPRTSTELANAAVVSEKHGTVGDANDMDRMGKLPVLRRQFKFFSIFGYAIMLGNTWEYSLIGLSMNLYNGGPAGGIWIWVVTMFGLFFVMLSMAELVSMAPTSGGQYHWVSEFAPKKYQKFLSYMTGWLCVAGWQIGMAGTSFAVCSQFQALIKLNMPSYEIQGWHGTLLSIGVVMFSITWNTVLVRKLPLLEGVGLVFHIFGFFAFLVVLWVMGPRSDVHDTWTKFEDPSGWGNKGLATLVGILGPLITLGSADTVCHLAEEVEDSAYIQPRAMLASTIVNYSLGFIMTVTVYSTLGDDLTGILNTPLGQPWMQVMLNATESKAATNVMAAALCVLVLFCTINQVTCSSRQLWSFARDKGLPCSDWISYVPPGWDIPVNAIVFTLFFASLLLLINIGSTIAFNILMSIASVAIFTSYIICISCVLRKRIVGEPLLPSRFSLGRAGIVVNVIALCFLSLIWVLLFFPTMPNPSLMDMNWTCLIYAFVITFSLIYYHVYGKHNYDGPVEYVKKLD